jgi:flagellar protein FliL
MATAPKSASKNAPDDIAEEAPKPKKSRKKLLFVLIVLLLLLGGGGGGAWWYFMGQDGDEKAAKNEKPIPPVFVVLEQFTVNLQPESGEHYLQVAMTLQVATKEDVDQIKLYMPQIRSRVLMLLSSKKASEISTVEGKKKLSDEILTQVNQPLSSQGKPQNVTNVFFTSFVIQ